MADPIRLHYRLEYQKPDGSWFMGEQDNSMLYLQGRAESYAENSSPRLAARLVRHRDGRVVCEWPASDAPQIGGVAGWPTADQCIRAAREALRKGQTARSAATDTEEQRERCRRALEVLDG